MLAVAGVVITGGIVAATRVLGGGPATAIAVPQPTGAVSPAAPPPFGPQVIPIGGPDNQAALLDALLVTYAPASPCAGVAVATPVDKVPAACAAAWSKFGVRLVPGQDMLRRAPQFPQISAGPGVTPHQAIELAAALWRTKTFQAFALSTRQLGLEDGLGTDHLLQRAGSEEQALEQGDRVSTPLCHFFPTRMRVVVLPDDFARFQRRSGRALGVKARFLGPCYATATDRTGTRHQIFSFQGADDVVFVGDVGSGDPLGAVLDVTGLGDCSADVARTTCAV